MPLRLLFLAIVAPVILNLCSAARADNPSQHPLVIGFERFHAAGKENSLRGGQLLLGELNCIACHQAEPVVQRHVIRRQAPILDGVGSRVRVAYLKAFLADPHGVKPGTTMPNLLDAVPEFERKDAVLALVHFLASTGTVKDPRPLPKSAAAGKNLYHQVGCAVCHGPRAGKIQGEANILPLGELSKKYSIVALAAFLLDPHKVRPAGRMPGLNLTVAEAQDIAHYLLADAKPPEGTLVSDAVLAKKGHALFAKLGCASCHPMNEGKGTIASKLKAPALAELNTANGCLAEKTTKTPNFSLSSTQRTALATAIKSLAKAPVPSTKDIIAHTFTVFNCYACHQRDGIGGVQLGLNDVFTTTQKEMGDEGRIPPHLNGVGGKLKPPFLRKVLADGSMDRPYMLTRMPKFGEANVGHLPAALEQADPVVPVAVPKFSLIERNVKNAGHFMVGNQAFGCIKCHNFREHKSGGVQGINMTIMAERLRREWFIPYLLDPNRFRPGTRMPAAWPLGQSQLPKVLGGNTAQQIEAIWVYLADGPLAREPFGIGRTPLPLIAAGEPIIYRNFIQGAGTRAIGVGYPEKINLAFDANDLRYALIWHNAFMDAARHWTDRGEGFEPPAGDGVLSLPAGPSIATLEKPDAPWPARADKDKGYKFRGYRLDDKRRPTFQYELGGIHIEDFMVPVEGKDGASFKRTVTITSGGSTENLFFRAAADSTIKDIGKGCYAVGSELRVHLHASTPPVLRHSGGKMELLAPIRDKKMTIVQEFAW